MAESEQNAAAETALRAGAETVVTVASEANREFDRGDDPRPGAGRTETAAAEAFAAAKCFSAMVAEAGDYARRSLENSSALVHKLAGATSFAYVVRIQSEYAKIFYADFLAHLTKLGEIACGAVRPAHGGIEAAIMKAPSGEA